jgi:outer membrane protein W
MNRQGWSRACVSAAASLVFGLSASGVQAAEGDSLSLKLASALRSDRLFVRAGVIFVKIKTKSGDTRDVTGPVISTQELKNAFYNKTEDDAELAAVLAKYPDVNFNVRPGVARPIDVLYEAASRQPNPSPGFPDNVAGKLFDVGASSGGVKQSILLLTDYLEANNLPGIGTPAGITGTASPETGTAGISLGYYLTDDYTWVVESYVLAAPLSTSVSIRGQAADIDQGQVAKDAQGNVTYHPIAINGQKIITSKLLPPSILLGRYWGDKDWKFRPYTGVMGMYAIFYDTKATQSLNSYVGGSNPGDTTVSIKNAFGAGPVIGFKYQYDDTWHASFNLGHIKLKTVATLTTRNTFIKSGDAILGDLGAISGLIGTGEQAYGAVGCAFGVTCDLVRQNGGLTSLISKGIANERGSSNSLGTYVRKTETELTNTIFMLSVGRTF